MSADQLPVQAPATVKWARGLIIANTLFDALAVGTAVWLVDYQPTEGFWLGYKKALVGSYPHYDYEAAGMATHTAVLQLLFAFPMLWALRKPGVGAPWVYIWFAIVFFFSIVGLQFPLLLIAALILLCRKSARTYVTKTKSPSQGVEKQTTHDSAI